MSSTPPPNTVWLLYGNGVHSADAFCPAQSNHPDAEQNLAPLYVKTIKEAGFNVNFTNDGLGLTDVAAVVAWDASPKILANLSRYSPKKCILLQYEPPVVFPEYYDPKIKNVFGKIFTMMDDYVDQVNYFKFCMPLHSSRLKRTHEIPAFENKKLCTLFNSNKMFARPNELYSERRKAIAFFTNQGEFDLYGPGWQGVSSWKGGSDTSLSFKIKTIKDYKFIICYENMGNQRGYVSEKLLDAFIGGCVPIYLGATNVTDYIPPETFIDKRNFNTYEDLYAFMKGINKNQYEDYLNAANDYLQSPKAQLFNFDYSKNELLTEIKKSQIEYS